MVCRLLSSAILGILTLTLAAAACGDGPGGGQFFLFLHDEPDGVDHGQQYWAGLLILSESGECLQLRDINSDGQVQTAATTRGGVFLPVWPRGHRSESNGNGVSILDSGGRVVASTGDIIRVGGYIRVEKPVVPREGIPADCRPLAQKLVGHDVSVITDSEASTLGLPGHSLHFPRELTLQGTRVFRLLGLEGRLELHGNCLRIGGERGPVPIWPPGFEPHVGEEGVIEVRSSGGATITRVGDWLEIMGRGKDVDTGPCAGLHWVEFLIRKVTRNGVVLWEG